MLESKRNAYVDTINARRRRNYNRRVEAYRKAVKEAQDCNERRYEAYRKRHAKYLLKLASWEAAKKKRQRRFWMKLRPPRWDQENPYRRLILTAVDRSTLGPITAYWDSARCPSNEPPHNNHHHLVNFVGGTFTEKFDVKDGKIQMAVADATWRLIKNNSRDVTTRLSDLQIRKAYDKLGNKSVHLGNLLAERAQTMSMLVNLTETIANILLSNKKNMLRWAAHLVHPKQVANEILAFKFGLQPLLQDLHSLAQLLNSDTDALSALTVRCNTKMPINFSTPQMDFSGVAEYSMVIKSTMDCDIPRLLDRLGLTNPYEVLVEVTPWSFVGDWFIPFSDWVASWSATRYLTFKSGTEKLRLVGEFNIKAAGASEAGYVMNTDDPCFGGTTGKYSGTFIDRTVMSGYPDRNRILQWKNPFSQWHAIESLSLIVQRLRM
jgi:hypothetical protein